MLNNPTRLSLIELDDHYDAAAELANVSVRAAPQPPVIIAARVESFAPVANMTRGTVLPSTTDMQRQTGTANGFNAMLAPADLDWDPVVGDLTADGLPVPSDFARAIVRSDTRACIGIVGKKYHPIPHRNLCALADAIVGASDGALRFANAGHRGNGSKVFMQLATRGTGPTQAEHLVNIITSHDGTSTLRVGYADTVIVCRNTYAKAFKSLASGLVIRHTASAEDTVKQATEIARQAADHGAAFDNAALRMMGERFSDDNLRRLASHLIPGDSTRSEHQRAALIRGYYSAPGAMPGTVWGAAQAVTYYTSHNAGSKAAREDAGIFGTGLAADMQDAAWWLLDTDETTRTERLQTVKVMRA